jgi:ABC-type sugar transport system ATPase subunit
VDVTTKHDLYAVLRQLAHSGKAIVLVSTELEELAQLCDRVIVLHRQAIAGDISRTPGQLISRHAILAAMFGQEE